MSRTESSEHPKLGRVKDARDRSVRQFDPVMAYLLHRDTCIPEDALAVIANELLPGARRKRLIQVVSVVLGFGIVIGGNLIYFRYFSSWKGLDPVNTTIYVVQLFVLLSGPLIAISMTRREYAGRVLSAMLRHKRCPACGYDLRMLPPDPGDGATVCPECGGAWRVP